MLRTSNAKNKYTDLTNKHPTMIYSHQRKHLITFKKRKKKTLFSKMLTNLVEYSLIYKCFANFQQLPVMSKSQSVFVHYLNNSNM